MSAALNGINFVTKSQHVQYLKNGISTESCRYMN